MTIKDHLEHCIDDVGMQLGKVYEGLDEAHYDHRVCPQAMSPREILEHLCECYTAVITETSGGTHEWGSFSIEDKSAANLKAKLSELRGQAKRAALAASDPKIGHAYIVSHDAYHVGQMALVRLNTDPNWNPYSLYGH
ncbi:MAG: hypothetical protein U0S12_14440 [Fimbriimonadales bacterium]